MSDSTAFMISSVLQDVALTGGTPANVACKTGTTNYDENTMNEYNMPWRCSKRLMGCWILNKNSYWYVVWI